MYEYKNISGPHLILLPKSTLSNWMNEFARWCPSLRAVRFHGNKEEREHVANTILRPTIKAEDREWDVCITTYEIANLEKSTLAKFAWRYLIIDEAHRLKNEASQFSQTVRVLNTQYRLLLTGIICDNLFTIILFNLPIFCYFHITMYNYNIQLYTTIKVLHCKTIYMNYGHY